MTSKRFIKIQFTLVSGNVATLYLGAHNFVVTGDKDGVCVDDGVHNNGGWKLAKSQTYEKVVARIDKEMKDAGIL